MSDKLTRKMIEEDVRSFLDNFKSSLKRRQQPSAISQASPSDAPSPSAEDGGKPRKGAPVKQTDVPKEAAQLILQRAKTDLLKNANAYADNNFSSKRFDLGSDQRHLAIIASAAGNDLPKNGGITYSEPLAFAMVTSAIATGLIEPQNNSYNVFVQKFNSDKKFANKALEVSKPAFDSISRGMFQALIDYGQGFGPKNKDGTPIRNEGEVTISLSTLNAIVKEQLEKSLRKQRS